MFLECSSLLFGEDDSHFDLRIFFQMGWNLKPPTSKFSQGMVDVDFFHLFIDTDMLVTRFVASRAGSNGGIFGQILWKVAALNLFI